MEYNVTVKVDGETVGTVLTNHGMTLEELMWSIGYDINSQEDCKRGYDNNVPGFYLDDMGYYAFDVENAKTETE